MKRSLPLYIFLLFSYLANAQYCVPTANCSYDDYIDDFSFNTISNQNTTGSNCGSNSYINTGLTTTVTKGSSYTMSMQSGPDWGQGFGVWIDYNRNQSFNDPGEFVFASGSATTNVVTATITIPNTALSGNTRLRVRSNYGATVNGNQSCSPFTYGETEDYTVMIQANNQPPVAEFFAGSTSTCSGTISFTDQSSGSPTSWLWDFGDGQTSTVQNPVHTYASPGTYTVTLTATNAFGSNTKTRTNYITYNPGSSPVAATCYPSTSNYCCGFGITTVSFNTILNNSTDGVAGYQDFTCTQTTVQRGKSYNLFVKVDQPAAHNVRAWIDYNNNGTFDSNELVLSADNVLQVTDTVAIPATAVLNTGLRMRVSADYYVNAAPGPCTVPQVGQVEDYTVIVQNNTSMPDADFVASPTTSCSGTVSFTDMSQNLPDTWNWTFGDGGTSTIQNPTHIYSASGTYNVRLIASNTYGSDTLIKSSYVTVNIGGSPIAASCSPVTTAYCCNYGIYNVALNGMNNTTLGGEGSYQDYSCAFTTNLNKGSSYTLFARTGPDNPEDLMAWIDYNNDGTFSSSEVVLNSTNRFNHAVALTVPMSAVINTPLRLRLMSDFVGSGLAPCDNVQWGQVEDYTVRIADPIGISTFEPTVSFNVFPNPFKEEIQVALEDPYNEERKLVVYDLSGRMILNEIMKAGVVEQTLNLGHLGNGMYVIKVSSSHFTRTQKILHEN